MSFGGGADVRPLAPRFSDIPLDLPGLASFTNFGGRMHHFGAGLAAVLRPEQGACSFAIGLLRDRLELQSFRADYQLLSGASAGTFGSIDYSATYPSWVPFAAAEWRLRTDDWLFAPRFVAGWPLPRSGWKGAIFGPGFEVVGDTSDVGRGVHIPDPFGGFGLGVGYRPWRLSVDAGALVNQALGEPLIHDGIDVVWLLSVSWDPATAAP